jgi:hypothetical protein
MGYPRGNIWPLVSGVLTITESGILDYITWHAQTSSAQQRPRQDIFLSCSNGDDPKTTDGRIAGVWSLSQYWHDPRYSQIAASTLGAILVTNADSPGPDAEFRIIQLLSYCRCSLHRR